MSVEFKIVSNIKETRYALKKWGIYMRAPTSISSCRGYPNKSCILSDGITKQKYAPVKTVPTLLVQKVDDAMKILQSFDSIACMALTHKYHYESIDREAAKDMNTSEKTYKTWCTNGENFIAGQIL